MYTLYHSKKEHKLEITKAKEVFARSPLLFTEEVTAYNDCYYSCKTRKPLVEKAREIKENWVQQAQYKLQQVSSIKI